MEAQIKKAIKAGNSSAVVLPRSWLNKEVRVELFRKTPEIILSDVINIARKYVDIKEIIGIYLVGSYARGEEDDSSDIDMLVITKNVDKQMINEGIYNLLIVSSMLLKQKLDNDLFPIGQMLKEAKPILNSDYLDSIEVKVTKKNTKWYLETTKDKLKIIKKILDRIKNKKDISDLVAYTLVLRIRTLCIIKKLILNEDYSKREFIKIIKKISEGTNAYEGYLAVKKSQQEKNRITFDETERLYKYLLDQLLEVKKILKNS